MAIPESIFQDASVNPSCLHSRDKAAAILWVRMQMARHGISVADLEATGCFQRPAANGPVLYRSAKGESWDGQGALPDWLQRAVNAGQSIEHFRIERA
jgi:DNA-binding protein H-NS